jgi:hypothetical protein
VRGNNRENARQDESSGFSISDGEADIIFGNRYRPEVVETTRRGGRRNAHLTREEEAEFMAPFVDIAQKGQIVRGTQIGKVFEEGGTLHHSIIYRLLDRHGWRKVVPRPFHTNAEKEIQEKFRKKLPEKVAEILADRDPEDTRPVAYMPQDEGDLDK